MDCEVGVVKEGAVDAKSLMLLSNLFAQLACVQRSCRRSSTALCKAMGMIVVVELGDLGSEDEDVAVGNVCDVSTSARPPLLGRIARRASRTGAVTGLGVTKEKYLVDMMLPRWRCFASQLCLDGDERTVGVDG
jgi:hypothetical protein